MIKPNDFCVNDAKYRCIWGCQTDWESLNKIQEERREKIVFMEVIKDRDTRISYVWLRDDEEAVNYIIAI